MIARITIRRQSSADHGAPVALPLSPALAPFYAWLRHCMSLVSAYSIRTIPAGNTTEPPRQEFRGFLGVSIGLAMWLSVMIVVDWKVHGIPNYNSYVTTIVPLLVAALLLVVVIKLELRTSSNRQRTTPTSSIPTVTIDAKIPTASGSPPARGEDHSVLQALFSVDMVLIFVTTICGISGLQTAMDNLGQIGESLGYDQGTISLLVSLANIWSYAGRVVGGFGSQHLVGRYGLARPWALTVTLVAACAGHLTVALGVGNGLYAASLITGFCLGAQWPVLFAVVSELFGLKHFGKLYNMVLLATPLGCIVLNVLVTGQLYDREAAGSTTCMGVRCFKVSFLIITGAAVIGAVASLVLAGRTAKFYVVLGSGGGATADTAGNDLGVDTV